MAPNRRKVVASRHLVCGNCRSWIQFESSGCGRTWAETRGESFAFTCKGFTEVTALEKEVEGLRQMVEDMMETVAGLQFEDKAAETEGRVTTTGVNQDREESAGNIRKEEMIAGVEDEGEIRTEERKVICAGATLMATHTYTRNPESPLGKEIDLQQLDTLIFKGEHAENEHWRLEEDRNGQVGYAPTAFLVVILDTAEEEEESDATKKGLENRTEENRIGQEGERRKSYSAAVIDGIKRKSRIFVGDSIVRKTDTRLSKEEDVVVCLPGARIEHVTERVEKIMGRGKGGTILVHIGTNNADNEGTTAIVDKYRKLLKKTKEARVEQIILSGILPVFGKRIDGYRNSKRMAINMMVKRLCKDEDVGYVDLWDSFVGKEGMYARDGLHLSGKGLPFLPRDSQGRLPVAWVKYDI